MHDLFAEAGYNAAGKTQVLGPIVHPIKPNRRLKPVTPG